MHITACSGCWLLDTGRGGSRGALQHAHATHLHILAWSQAEGREGLLDKGLLYTLLNRLKEFTDWAQCAVLELAAAYKPAGEAEVRGSSGQ